MCALGAPVHIPLNKRKAEQKYLVFRQGKKSFRARGRNNDSHLFSTLNHMLFGVGIASFLDV